MTTELTIRNEYAPEVWDALKNSVYPGAKDESICMALSYCKSMKLDPLLKPGHLVPMSVKDKDGKYVQRDVFMPGIALYRILAARSGNYAGMSEPEFGPDIEETFIDKFGNNHKVKYPEWCKLVVKKMLNGILIEFTAKEYWKENYATMGKDSSCPNSMWEKRPYGQLAKCAEAQALRKAFPESLGGMVTAEEMEGKGFENAKIVNDVREIHKSTIAAKNNQTKSSTDLNAEAAAKYLDVDEVRKKATENLFNIDGKFVEAMDVHTIISEKIETITDYDQLTAYESWKQENQQGLAEFAKRNKEMALQYADAINLKRETLAGAHAE